MKSVIKIFWTSPGEGRRLFTQLFDTLRNLSLPVEEDKDQIMKLPYYTYARLKNKKLINKPKMNNSWAISPANGGPGDGFDYILSYSDFNLKNIAYIKLDTVPSRFSSLSIHLLPYTENPFVSSDILPQYAFLFAEYLLKSFYFIQCFQIKFINSSC